MKGKLNRGTGLLILNVVNSNPNGDPDTDSDPRVFDDGRGLISPVSFKRKVRDLMTNPDDKFVDWPKEKSPSQSDVRAAAMAAVKLTVGRNYDILETRYRRREDIAKMDAASFTNKYWDARLFGNTFLESLKGLNAEGKKEKAHFISTGVIQFGPGVSIAPIEVQRLTLTNKSGVEGDKDRGMAPLAFRVVRHAVYAMPFFVNPSAAAKTGCDAADVDLLKFLIPHAYTHTASGVRPQVDVLHAWYAEHKNPLGSCPDPLILGALAPRKLADPERASISLAGYEIPTALPAEIMARLNAFEDLCVKDWSVQKAA